MNYLFGRADAYESSPQTSLSPLLLQDCCQLCHSQHRKDSCGLWGMISFLLTAEDRLKRCMADCWKQNRRLEHWAIY